MWSLKSKINKTSSQDGGIGRHTGASLHNQNKDNNKFKNKKQPELIENKTVWKSNSQEVKEDTFVQTCRRGGDGQPSGEDLWQGGGWQSRWSHIRVQSPIHVWINWEEQLGSKIDLATQESNVGK